MNVSAPFIHRPVATTLLTIAIAIAGAIAFHGAAGFSASAGGLPDDFGECGFAGTRAPRSWLPRWRLRWNGNSATSRA